MVEQVVFALDSEALTVANDSPHLTPGTSIINNADTPDGTIFVFSGGTGEYITIEDTQNTDVFDDNLPGDHTIVDGGSLVDDGTQVESESLIELQELDEDGNPTGPVITINVYSQNGATSDIWGFSFTDQLEPGKEYVKVGGSNNGDSDYDVLVACFTAGTQILTDIGPQPVETIAPGDMVWTRSSGYKAVQWSGRTTVTGLGDFAPIWFGEGTIGNDRPMRLSPNHRILYTSSRSHLFFADGPVLIPAQYFVGLPNVVVAPVPRIDYFHFMFDQHEIVESDGCLTESFYPGEMAVRGLEHDARNELLNLFPDLATPSQDTPFPMAAPPLRRYEARLVLGLTQ